MPMSYDRAPANLFAETYGTAADPVGLPIELAVSAADLATAAGLRYEGDTFSAVVVDVNSRARYQVDAAERGDVFAKPLRSPRRPRARRS